MVKYCPKCGAENEDDGEFCVECGNNLVKTSNNSVSINKKTILISVVVIVVIAIVGLLVLTEGNLGDVQYIASNPITVDSVTLINQGELNNPNKTGLTKSYKVAFTANENIDRCSIECYAYAEDGSALSTLETLFTPHNIVALESNLTAGSTYTGTVDFGTPNSTADFTATKFEFFVYHVDDGELKLIDKVTYNVP